MAEREHFIQRPCESLEEGRRLVNCQHSQNDSLLSLLYLLFSVVFANFVLKYLFSSKIVSIFAAMNQSIQIFVFDNIGRKCRKRN